MGDTTKPKTDALVALYASDFFASRPQALNSLCLYYDRVFLFDYFGVSGGLDWADSDRWPPFDSDYTKEQLWAWTVRLSGDAINQLREADDDPFDVAIRRAVAQGFGSSVAHRLTPEFIKDFSKRYTRFLKDTVPLFKEGVLGFVHDMGNPFSPANTFRSLDFTTEKIEFDPRATPEQIEATVADCRDQLRYACTWEHAVNGVPILLNHERDAHQMRFSFEGERVQWRRSANVIAQTMAMTAIAARVPTVGHLPAEEILEARHRLGDSLPAFRRLLLEGAWEVAMAVRDGSPQELKEVCRLFYDTRMEPIVRDLEAGLKESDRSATKGLLEKGVDATIMVAKYLDPTDSASKWDVIGSGLKSLLKIDSYLQDRRQPNPQAGYEFLVQLPRVVRDAQQAGA